MLYISRNIDSKYCIHIGFLREIVGNVRKLGFDNLNLNNTLTRLWPKKVATKKTDILKTSKPAR